MCMHTQAHIIPRIRATLPGTAGSYIRSASVECFSSLCFPDPREASRVTDSSPDAGLLRGSHPFPFPSTQNLLGDQFHSQLYTCHTLCRWNPGHGPQTQAAWFCRAHGARNCHSTVSAVCGTLKSYTSIPHIRMVTSGLPLASYFNRHPPPKVLEWLCGCPILQQPRRKGCRSLIWLLKEARAGREAG